MNFHLPYSESLPIRQLAGCFKDRAATYKFYWFLSILQLAEQGQKTIDKRHIFARMIANAWYTVNYFHITFGNLDSIQKAIEIIRETENLPVDEHQDIITETLIRSQNKQTIQALWHFNKNVPHWFLSPWFPVQGNSESYSHREKRIYRESQQDNNIAPYALFEKHIVISDAWLEYFAVNSKFLQDFCYWNLAMFLQSKNPNVPDIPNKLIKPAQRSGLQQQRKYYWDLVFDEMKTIPCLYTGKELTTDNYAVEHFIPFSFVSHDLIWNLAPADRSFNSSKSDKLPILDKYFDPFYHLHRKSLKIIRDKKPNSKILEEYLTIYPDLDYFIHGPEQETKQKYRNHLEPLITIAANSGFPFMS